MPSFTGPLDTFATAVVNAAGAAIVPLGPTLPHEHWQPGSAYVTLSTNVLEASCVLYMGTSAQTLTSAIAQTSKGSSGSTAALSGDMPSGYKLFAVWAGGDVGSTATLRVTGTRTIGAPAYG